MYLNHYKGGSDFKILDNGVAEGVETEWDDLFNIAAQLGVHEIVVPDAMGECDRTIDLALDFKKHLRNGFQYMGVAQGKSLVEVLKCTTALDKMGYMTTLGVPRCLNRIIHKAFRQSFLEGILPRNTFDFVDYHCLGTSEWITEVKALADIDSPKLRGIDTSLPCVMGLAGKRIDEHEYRGRPDDFFGAIPTEWQYNESYHNCAKFLTWAQAPPVG
jgi:hypothetical protein